MSSVYLQLQEPRPRVQQRWALWELGFRPFYLLAAACAALSVPLWALQFTGLVQAPLLKGAAWHAHEMVFGYTLAVVIGFLFTAGRNWSGQATPTGRPLMALAALWVLARVLVLTPWTWAALAANVAVPWLAAWGLWRALRRGQNRRNYFFVGLLAAMGVAAGVLHLNLMRRIELPAGLGLPVALDIVLFMIVVMAGRILPMFSNNGVPGLNAQRKAWVERAALGTVLALMALDALGIAGLPLQVLLVLAVAVHSLRLLLWQPWRVLAKPLVWVLQLAYAWLPIHLALRLGAEQGWWAAGPATHALTLGLIGMITMGMITRTALGHTGRPLQAGPVEMLAYGALGLAAVVRVFLPLVWPAALVFSVQVSALLWLFAFGLYLWHYTPMLMRPRADGLPG